MREFAAAAIIVAIFGGLFASMYFDNKGRAEAAIELARQGASPMAVQCVLKPPPPMFWNDHERCRRALEAK